MCEDKAHGGDRCPSSQKAYRRADRAAEGASTLLSDPPLTDLSPRDRFAAEIDQILADADKQLPARIMNVREAVLAIIDPSLPGGTERQGRAGRAERAVTAMGARLADKVDLRAKELAGTDPVTAQHRAQATLETIRDLRPLGASEPLPTVDSDFAAEKLVNRSAGCFPTDWLEKSAALNLMRVLVSEGRGHYIGGDCPVLAVPDHANVDVSATATHELAHRMEDANRQLGFLEQAFLARRCVSADGTPEPYQPYLEGPKTKAARWGAEKVQPDGFVDRYVGKTYRNEEHREVLSMGMEAVIHGRYGGLLGEGGFHVDEDHRAFILGLLACA